jgi:hypothetical protein
VRCSAALRRTDRNATERYLEEDCPTRQRQRDLGGVRRERLGGRQIRPRPGSDALERVSVEVREVPGVPMPDPTGYAVLNDVLALSTTDVYAVGGMEWACGEDGDDTCSEPLILHWNGKAWSSTVMAKTYASFTRVTSDGAGGLWLLQGGWNPQLWHVSGDLVTHVAAPKPSGHDIDVNDLATNGTTVWAGSTEFPEGDPDDPTGNGVYLRTG